MANANSVPADQVGIDVYIDTMPQLGASDLHVKSGAPIMVRLGGSLRAMDMPPLSPEQSRNLAYSMLEQDQVRQLESTGSVDLAYATAKGCRVRVNVFYQRGTVSIAARFVNPIIPSFEDLLLPAATLQRIASFEAGMVVVAGPTGSGKSTTLAATIDYINRTRKCHILTLEDPIEYIFEDDKALINQREIGIDQDTFANALKFALREDPDVILMGEMRDAETVQIGLTAAETGHLVFGTLHAATAPQTISRLLDLFPAERQNQIRKSLTFNLRAVLCQKLLRCVKKDRRRVPAIEIMIVNAPARKLIDDAEDRKLAELVRRGEAEGMIDFTHSIHSLVQRQLVTQREALANAPNPDQLQSLFDGLDIG
jgi:twitching motility protein PilT